MKKYDVIEEALVKNGPNPIWQRCELKGKNWYSMVMYVYSKNQILSGTDVHFGL